jgi:hypothetical protein
MPKKKQAPSQQEITVRDRRALNKKIAAVTARIDGLEARLLALEQALERVLEQMPSARAKD